MIFHPCPQNRGINGFGNIISGPQSEPSGFILNITHCSNENNGYVFCIFICFQIFANFISVHLRHHDIEQDKVGLHFLNNSQCPDAVCGKSQLITLMKRLLHEL